MKSFVAGALWLLAVGAGCARPAHTGWVAVRGARWSRLREVRATVDEQVAASEQIVAAIGEDATRIRSLVVRAQREGEARPVECLADKLRRADATLESAREHRGKLLYAVTYRIDVLRDHEFELLTVFGDRSGQLVVECGTCYDAAADARPLWAD